MLGWVGGYGTFNKDKKRVTLTANLKMYQNYVTKTYINQTMVFDDFSGSSAKDKQHLKWGCLNLSTETEFVSKSLVLSRKMSFYKIQEKEAQHRLLGTISWKHHTL